MGIVEDSSFEVDGARLNAEELDIHRRNARLADRAIERFLQQMRPGMTENELWGALAKETFAHGALHAECRLLCSGPRTNPWMQEATDRVVEDGDPVAFDTDLVGPHGYVTAGTATPVAHCTARAPIASRRRRVRRAIVTGSAHRGGTLRRLHVRAGQHHLRG